MQNTHHLPLWSPCTGGGFEYTGKGNGHFWQCPSSVSLNKLFRFAEFALAVVVVPMYPVDH